MTIDGRGYITTDSDHTQFIEPVANGDGTTTFSWSMGEKSGTALLRTKDTLEIDGAIWTRVRYRSSQYLPGV